MSRFPRWYGANPLHLLVLICSLAVTGYACVRLFAQRPVEVAIWLVGAAVLHDLILLPLYSLADLSARSVLRHRARHMPTPAWINYLRVPSFLSGVLLLVWFPLIFRLPGPYRGATGLTDAIYIGRWLAVTAILFGVSALLFALKLGRIHRQAPGDEAQPPRAPRQPSRDG
ncbi:hypothetical protein [Actinacidiphila glaucinigra]|uniref:hypothetical protein n=1 Tax=Actinacidiphila glaucinigra TaxID=235986 RepID=UPI00371D9691